MPQYSLNRLTGAPIFTKSFKTDGETQGKEEYIEGWKLKSSKGFCKKM